VLFGPGVTEVTKLKIAAESSRLRVITLSLDSERL
jgi:hypothetical protein